jgi:hypothetical protein
VLPLPHTLPSPRVRGKKAILRLFPFLPSTSHPSLSPSPPCLGHRRPLPLVLLRPHLLHPEHLSSPWDLYVHFNARLELFSGLPPTTPHRPSTPSWRVPLGEPPVVVCLKSEPRSTGAAPKPLPCRPATAEFHRRVVGVGGGGEFSLPCFSPGGLRQPAGLCQAGLCCGVARLSRRPQGQPSGAVRPWATSGPRGRILFKNSVSNLF